MEPLPVSYTRYNGGMTDPRLPLLVEELRARGCHTVVLYGSRARGDFTPESDYDVAGVRAGGDEERDARPWEGSFLDAFIYPERAVAELKPGMDRLAGGVVLCERDGFGRDLLLRATLMYHRPIDPLPPGEHAALKAWPRKMLARIARGDVEANYRRAWLLYQLLEDYFALRALAYRGPKESLGWLAAQDPAVETAFRTALQPGAELGAIEALVDLVVDA